MKPAPVMTLPNARLSTLVTLNCSVNPTALIASSAAVTKPKPTAETKTATSWGRRPTAWAPGPRSTRCGLDLGGAQQRGDRPVAVHVALDGEPLARVVPLVEHRRADRAHVLDALALRERSPAVRIGVDDDRALRR